MNKAIKKDAIAFLQLWHRLHYEISLLLTEIKYNLSFIVEE
jgi:hypothetical protein